MRPPAARTEIERIGAERARSVRVFAPTGRPRSPVVRWAARHAARTGGSLQVLVDPDIPDEDPAVPRSTAGLLGQALRDLLARVVGPLRPAAPGSLTRDLVGAVAGARLLVVPQSLPQLTALAEVLTEPLVAVPDRPLPPRDDDVVLALAPWTGPEVVGAAFETAARYGADLRVVAAAAPGSDPQEVARSCEDDLAAWRLVRPEVTVDVRVVDGDPTDALLQGTEDAQLAVAGRPARGRAREIVAPSPATELLRAADCPVLVVPPPGSPRTTWSARPGWGTTR